MYCKQQVRAVIECESEGEDVFVHGPNDTQCYKSVVPPIVKLPIVLNVPHLIVQCISND